MTSLNHTSCETLASNVTLTRHERAVDKQPDQEDVTKTSKQTPTIFCLGDENTRRENDVFSNGHYNTSYNNSSRYEKSTNNSKGRLNRGLSTSSSTVNNATCQTKDCSLRDSRISLYSIASEADNLGLKVADHRAHWRYVSRVFDRFFFYCYLVISAIFMGVIGVRVAS